MMTAKLNNNGGINYKSTKEKEREKDGGRNNYKKYY